MTSFKYSFDNKIKMRSEVDGKTNDIQKCEESIFLKTSEGGKEKVAQHKQKVD
jgi:hypothetical protein